MHDHLKLNVALLKRRVPNLTAAARSVGLRPATVSNLCTGKTPIGRAEVKTLVTLATLANCTLDELIIGGSSIKMMETGIKVLDVFSPIVEGGTNGLVARSQVGQLVLLSEIFYRMKNRGFTTVLLAPGEKGAGIKDVEFSSDFICNSVDEVVDCLLKIDNKEQVLLASTQAIVVSGELFTLRDKLDDAKYPDITTFLFDPSGRAVDEDDPFGPLETRLQFDVDIAGRGLYPAVNPVYSTSTMLEDALLDNNHLTIQRRAKKLLRRYREIRLLSNTIGFQKFAEADRQIFHRGERLEAFLSQPFFVAEEFTKITGENVTLQDSLTGIQRIVDGAADDVDIRQLTYIGVLP
ncbi:ATP synthase beta subunit C-terminal domain-containing protein [Bacillus sp. 2205SS5-2]|uniref:ATP synthase beta subunit C-terminal domain-containing protein n=1 Tax=Bacillus sp. 2205SS5-2 TaxID=3109031 RepID=UPI0030041101